MGFKTALKTTGKFLKRKKVGTRLAVTAGTALIGRKLVRHGEKKGQRKGYRTGRSVGRIEGIVASHKSMSRKKRRRR